jgi:predicted DNA-binding protein (MmcQ/YjbR family)
LKRALCFKRFNRIKTNDQAVINLTESFRTNISKHLDKTDWTSNDDEQI